MKNIFSLENLKEAVERTVKTIEKGRIDAQDDLSVRPLTQIMHEHQCIGEKEKKEALKLLRKVEFIFDLNTFRLVDESLGFDIPNTVYGIQKKFNYHSFDTMVALVLYYVCVEITHTLTGEEEGDLPFVKTIGFDKKKEIEYIRYYDGCNNSYEVWRNENNNFDTSWGEEIEDIKKFQDNFEAYEVIESVKYLYR